MISRIVFLLILFNGSSLSAQVSDSEMENMKTKWRAGLTVKARNLEEKTTFKEGMSEFADSIQRLFLKDTFIVENLYRKQLDADATTLGMNKAALACASEYELLIDKYYTILLDKMNPEDRELVISWQANWKVLMEKERALTGKLMKEEYSGGGSIHSLTYTSRLMNAQKEHVLILIDYLTHLI
ncbi:hypothetical protein [uncultured Fluviicola sp.]|uniref:hypothetical protein n=1 Tax=uncultured Fluviicola sp. TaxID=463303 RepID=UPI0025DE718C|nr:hypothetical protein [uncultured Fluviicola sp.]